MGIFSFLSNKKENAKDNASLNVPSFNKPSQPNPSTVTRDSHASFEVPDFSEEDLDFDLGLDDFTPQDLTAVPSSPSGRLMKEEILPTIAEPVEEIQDQPEILPEPEKPLIEEDQELPTFNLQPNINVEEELKKLASKSPPEVRKKQKLVSKKLEKKKEPELKSVHKSSENHFLEKSQYIGMLLVTDMIQKESNNVGNMGKDLEDLFKKEENGLADVKRNITYVKDKILLIDEQMFGEG